MDITEPKAIRPLIPGDRARIEEMWERCSPTSRYSRLHSPCPALPASYLEAVMGNPSGSRVCVDAGRVVGLGSLIAGSEGVADLGVVVEDAWQRHGIGTVLVASLVAGAGARGITVITATVLGSQVHLAQAMRRLPGDCTITSSGPTITAMIRLWSNASPWAEASLRPSVSAVRSSTGSCPEARSSPSGRRRLAPLEYSGPAERLPTSDAQVQRQGVHCP